MKQRTSHASMRLSLHHFVSALPSQVLPSTTTAFHVGCSAKESFNAWSVARFANGSFGMNFPDALEPVTGPRERTRVHHLSDTTTTTTTTIMSTSSTAIAVWIDIYHFSKIEHQILRLRMAYKNQEPLLKVENYLGHPAYIKMKMMVCTHQNTVASLLRSSFRRLGHKAKLFHRLPDTINNNGQGGII